jgi:hypothetical protein
MTTVQSFLFAAILCCLSAPPLRAQGASPEQLTRIRELQKPIREKVEGILKADPLGRYSVLVKDMERLNAISDRKKRAEQLRAMEGRHLEWVRKAYAEAAIDRKAYASRVADILGSRLRWRLTEFLGVVVIDQLLVLADPPPASGTVCKEFVNPCDLREWYPSDARSYSIRENSGECWVYAHVSAMVAGSRESGAHAGMNVEVPPSQRRLRAKARVKFSLEATATAVLGGSYGEASIGLSVKGPDVNQSQDAVRIQVLAPVIMFATDRVEDDRDIGISLAPPTRGGIFSVVAWVRTKTVAGGIAGTGADAEIIPLRRISVCWER